ncbi:Hypp7941 [Branchiostoma lanceolatum]|uniref:Hypp7941 protein n=1 Tax=Branchiostoma lanceolatum TaxID=7740 RepID=A0A8J9Z4J1_BRALA|nr:Hypp7941 [Branchiostoma lanceolatum]
MKSLPGFPPCVIAAVQDGDVTSPYKYRRASAPHFPPSSVRQAAPRPRVPRPKIVPNERSDPPYEPCRRLYVQVWLAPQHRAGIELRQASCLVGRGRLVFKTDTSVAV